MTKKWVVGWEISECFDLRKRKFKEIYFKHALYNSNNSSLAVRATQPGGNQAVVCTQGEGGMSWSSGAQISASASFAFKIPSTTLQSVLALGDICGRAPFDLRVCKNSYFLWYIRLPNTGTETSSIGQVITKSFIANNKKTTTF